MTDGIQVIAQSLQETYVSQSLAATARQEVNLYESEMLSFRRMTSISPPSWRGGCLPPFR